MALSINGLGIQSYGMRLREFRDSEDGTDQQRSVLAKNDTGKTRSSVQISLSGAARQRVQEEEEANARLAKLSPEDRQEVKTLVGELESMVNTSGGFRRLSETQWERVDEIQTRISEINGEDPAEGSAKLQDLKQVYSLEAELESLYSGDEPMTTEQRERADAIMEKLGTLFGDQEPSRMAPEQEKQVDDLEDELDKLMDKFDKWTLTPADEQRVNVIFSQMESLFQGAEQHVLANSI